MRPIFKKLIPLLFLAGLLAEVSVYAQGKDEQSVKTALDANLAKARPGIQTVAVEKTAVPGLYEVSLNNGDLVYASADGQYLLAGSLYRLDPTRLVDVHEEKLVPIREKVLAAIPATDTINFAPAVGEPRAIVHVFTDVDCAYCQKLHSHMAEFNAAGIEIRYLAFPRAGVNSVSAKKLVSAWCSEDRNDAINKLKARQSIPEKSCDNPVAAQYALGQKLGVTGTPAVFRADGTLIGGYLTPQQMLQQLGL